MELIGGAIGTRACATLRQGNKTYIIADDIPLLHFLSGMMNLSWCYTVTFLYTHQIAMLMRII